MLFARNNPATLAPAEAAEPAARDDIALVDVRDADERAQGRPPRSLHIPLTDLRSRLQERPRARTVAVICRSGSRSQMAARAAAGDGRAVANVRGGLVAWSKAGLPVESGPEADARGAR